MPCTTILIGKNAAYDGSTIMARNEDSGSTGYDPKKFVVVMPEDQPVRYQSVISGVEITLPDHPVRYTMMPNALPEEGIWGAAGINAHNVAMTATETITSNARVLGADPLVKKGIGEEDMVTLVLPYISSAREGVLRLGGLLQEFGTYEKNGIGFQDMNEIWWLESIGGHHWMAKRVPDDAYVVMPNQQGIDTFDFADAYGEQKNHLCSVDLVDFIEKHYLDRSMSGTNVRENTKFDVRGAFGSHSDADHIYNTPRAWYMERYFNPRTYRWDGEQAEYDPESDDLPWCLIPEKKITIDEVKYILSSHYQGTPYDPYGGKSGKDLSGKYRSIGIDRNNFLAITQLRPGLPKEIMAVEWLAVGSNSFNTILPFYGNVNRTPAYLADTGERVTTDSLYWTNRLIAALSDAHYANTIAMIERYQGLMEGKGMEHLNRCDQEYLEGNAGEVSVFLEECNEKMAALAKEETDKLLGQVLYTASVAMRNAYNRSDS